LTILLVPGWSWVLSFYLGVVFFGETFDLEQVLGLALITAALLVFDARSIFICAAVLLVPHVSG